MIPGGLSFDEQQAWLSRQRLEIASEKHTIAKLPCCGSGVEIADPTKDTYVICPNPRCRKRGVVLSGLTHEIRMEQPSGLNFDYNF